jgi:hypothetical protein
MKELKLNQIIELVNERLKENINKEVIDKGYNEYDEVNGRKVIKEYELKKIMNEYAGDEVHFYVDKGRILSFCHVAIDLKRKKSGMISRWSYSDQLTFSELSTTGILDSRFLDMTIAEIKTDYIKERDAKDAQEEQAKKAEIDYFMKSLKDAGITLKDFETLKNTYSSMSYGAKRKLGID